MPSGAAVLALAGLAMLSGCSWFSFSSSKSAAASCANPVILRPLANTALFAPGAQPQPMNVAFYGILSDASAKCEVAEGTLRASLDIVVAAERGPAAKTDSVDLEYFVALTGPDQAIIGKTPFRVHVAFPGNARRAGVTDHIEEAIALGGRKVSDLTLMVGFQQTPEVVEFYRHFRGR